MSTKLTQPICACGAFQTLQTFFKRNGEQVYFHACNPCGKKTNYYPTAAEADVEWAYLAPIKVGNHGNP